MAFSLTARTPALVLAGALLLTPLQLDSDGTVSPARACAQSEVPPASGTCCLELGAICVIGGVRISGYYYKAEGSCKPQG